MKNMMKFKGYLGSVNYSDEDKIFYGKLEFIRSLISYEGSGVKSLNLSFEEAVEDYLELCAETNKKPEKPFKGTFNVRTGSELHRKAVLYANDHGLNLNKLVVQAIEEFLPKQE